MSKLLEYFNPVKHISIRRQHLVEDVFKAYEEDLLLSVSLLEVEFEGEDAIDCGGVKRDLFCSFWEQILNNQTYNLFTGHSAKVPVFNPANAEVAVKKLPILGRILSHSYILTGCFPTSISIVSVIGLFLGCDIDLEDDHLLESFFEFLPPPESQLLKTAMTKSTFTDEISERLLDFYSVNGLPRIPKPKTLHQDILHLAKFILFVQPQNCFRFLLSQLPPSHESAWSSLTIDDFIIIYEDQCVTPRKIVDALKPDFDTPTPQQDKNLYFLKTFIRELSPEYLHKFLRFVTGSSNLLVSNIDVTFHSACQLPRSMTCSNTIILSTTYDDYSTFKKDFLAVLGNDDSFLMLSA